MNEARIRSVSSEEKAEESEGKADTKDSDTLRLIFQGKWRLQVLYEISKGPRRLSELRRAIPLATKKMLIETLRTMESFGWISRREIPSKTKRVEYQLTESYEATIRKQLQKIS